MGLVTAVKSLWNSETIENDAEIIMINPELVQAWVNIENGKLKRRVTEAVHSAKGGSTLRKRYETHKIEIITEKETNSNKKSLDEMIDTLSKQAKDREK